MLVIEKICKKRVFLIDTSKRNYKAISPTIFGRKRFFSEIENM
jgi:hypothetical protein|tara:strand:+ start:1523 stop:1651 length:129 start_codon:yes stop_codon:yes gene_type:complete